MKIEDVVRETVIGLFSSPEVWDRLVLKGGTALRLGEGIESRMSLDIDFSTEGRLEDVPEFFQNAEETIRRRFDPLGWDVIDARHVMRPKKPVRTDWKGYEFTFKLSDKKLRNESLPKRIRAALIPIGSNSSKIVVQISEGEYTGSIKEVVLDGVSIRIYSEALMVLEKLRSICQQHPSYQHSLNKNRARDFFDIYQVVRKYRRNPGFHDELKFYIGPVFEAKEVPLELLQDEGIFDTDFLNPQKLGFPSVRDTVTGPIEDFEFYVEQLKILVKRIRD